VEAPADFAAFSILDLHMPQLPATFSFVEVCALTKVVEAINKPINKNIFFIK
jgi:hypothetical protein